MSDDKETDELTQGERAVNRILGRGEQASALGSADTHGHSDTDGDQFDREDRNALKRVAGLSTEREDITDVEYRQLRLEKVILIGLWGEVPIQDAENSLRELAALAETAGATVLDGLLQRRAHQTPQPIWARARPRNSKTWLLPLALIRSLLTPSLLPAKDERSKMP